MEALRNSYGAVFSIYFLHAMVSVLRLFLLVREHISTIEATPLAIPQAVIAFKQCIAGDSDGHCATSASSLVKRRKTTPSAKIHGRMRRKT